MRRVLILALLAVLTACTGPNRIARGGAPCDPLWDRMDYRAYVLEKNRAGEVPVTQQEFGACKDDDLASHTSNGHGSHGHHR